MKLYPVINPESNSKLQCFSEFYNYFKNFNFIKGSIGPVFKIQLSKCLSNLYYLSKYHVFYDIYALPTVYHNSPKGEFPTLLIEDRINDHGWAIPLLSDINATLEIFNRVFDECAADLAFLKKDAVEGRIRYLYLLADRFNMTIEDVLVYTQKYMVYNFLKRRVQRVYKEQPKAIDFPEILPLELYKKWEEDVTQLIRKYAITDVRDWRLYDNRDTRKTFKDDLEKLRNKYSEAVADTYNVSYLHQDEFPLVSIPTANLKPCKIYIQFPPATGVKEDVQEILEHVSNTLKLSELNITIPDPNLWTTYSTGEGHLQRIELPAIDMNTEALLNYIIVIRAAFLAQPVDFNYNFISFDIIEDESDLGYSDVDDIADVLEEEDISIEESASAPIAEGIDGIGWEC